MSWLIVIYMFASAQAYVFLPASTPCTAAVAAQHAPQARVQAGVAADAAYGFGCAPGGYGL